MDAHSPLVQVRSVSHEKVGTHAHITALVDTGDTVVYHLDFGGITPPQTADFVVHNQGMPVVDYKGQSGRRRQGEFGFKPVAAAEVAKNYPMAVVVAYLTAVETYVADHSAELGWLPTQAVACLAADFQHFKQGTSGKNDCFALPVYPA